AEGRITALRARVVAPLGAALMNAAAGPPWNHARLLPGAYVVPACEITVTGALTTTTPVAAYRGAGRPEACFFIERLMDTAVRAGDGDHRVERPRPGARDDLRPDRGRPSGRHAG